MNATDAITIRPAYGDDEVELRRLAALDSARALPPAPMLGAEIEGELRAALSLSDGAVIADPFFLTGELVELLRARAAALKAPRPRRAGLRLAALRAA